MSNIVFTRNGKRFLKKAKTMLVTPFYYDSADAKYYLGPDTYDIFAIIGDTIKITQESNDTESIENEFSPIPVIENTTMGKWQFSADCLDMQNSVLRQLFSAKTARNSNGKDVEGVVAMPSDFRTIYCCIQIAFENDDMPRIVMPRILLSSGMSIASLRTGIAQNKIQGTPMSTQICVRESEEQLFLFDDGETSTYFPRTPLLFVPNDSDFGVLHHKDNDLTYMSMYEKDEVVCFDTETGSMIISE